MVGVSQVCDSCLFNDGHGGQVFLPLGSLSFIDEVVHFSEGKPKAIPEASIPSNILGVPDFNGLQQGFLSLGCKGEVIVKFNDNALVNIEGDDIYVFELGKYLEPIEMSISKDGKKWVAIGEIKGGKSAVDIGKYVLPGEVFYYVKLKDVGEDCDGSWPGADIDAVAAIGSGKRISLNAELLFDYNKSELKISAQNQIDSLLKQIKYKEDVEMILIEGHTDSIGSAEYNIRLSQNRAKAVNDFMLSNGVDAKKIKYYGYGAMHPLTDNHSEESRKLNRRVEIVIIPIKKK